MPDDGVDMSALFWPGDVLGVVFKSSPLSASRAAAAAAASATAQA